MKELKMERETTKKEYSFIYKVEKEDPRQAVIYFVNGKFIECKFYGLCGIYTFNDWEFLGKVAEKVCQLCKAKS